MDGTFHTRCLLCVAGFDVEEQAKGGVDGAQAIANAALAVFFAALFLQLLRWLLIRREFSKAALKATRDMKLAHFNVLVALAENVPQAVLSALFAGLVGWTSWNALNIALSLFMLVFTLATPVLLQHGLL